MEPVSQAGYDGEVTGKDRRRRIAKIIRQAQESEDPYFARRRPGTKVAAIMNRSTRGTDSTAIIAEDRAVR